MKKLIIVLTAVFCFSLVMGAGVREVVRNSPLDMFNYEFVYNFPILEGETVLIAVSVGEVQDFLDAEVATWLMPIEGIYGMHYFPKVYIDAGGIATYKVLFSGNLMLASDLPLNFRIVEEECLCEE